MMRWASSLLVLFSLGATSLALGQPLPDVRDVYSAQSPSDGLGPRLTPGAVLGEATASLRGRDAFRYEARLAVADSTSSPDLSATVVMARGSRGTFDRFRATMRVSRGAEEAFELVVGSNGESFFATDGRGAVLTGPDLASLGERAELLEGLLLPALGRLAEPDAEETIVTFPPISEVGGEPCFTTHFVDELRGEHVYVALSATDASPLRVERIRLGADGVPVESVVDVTGFAAEKPPSPDTFEPPPSKTPR